MKKIKILIGGSPCTKWSIAQKNGRETTASGIGWELFCNYLIAKEKFNPDFFLYENNKSAAAEIKEQIAKKLEVWNGDLMSGADNGVRFNYINSALVSAQNRQRFYVTNFGNIEQPEDRGILLKDILESGVIDKEKSYALTTRCSGAIPSDTFSKHRHTMICEPVGAALRTYPRTPNGEHREKRPEIRNDEKSNCLTSVQMDSMVCEPIKLGEINNGGQGNRLYSIEGKSVAQTSTSGGMGSNTGLYAVPIETEELDNYYYKGDKNLNVFGKIICENTSDNNGQPAQGTRIYRTDSKSICLDGDSRKYIIDKYGENFESKNKPVKIYEVKDGLITIKDKQYPIKLADGFYIIRKLTVKECCRLQTMPDNYCKAVSDSQAYKGLGNGWTAEVIIHLLNHALKDVPRDTQIEVLSMYDGIGTGRYCLDKMRFTNVTYKAYEIDKWAMQVANDNYADIIQCGDAFAVRNENWQY